VCREQEIIPAQLHELSGDDAEFQARLDASKEQDGNIDLSKAQRLIDELILRKSKSFRPRRQSALSSSGPRRRRDAGTKRNDGDSPRRNCAFNWRRTSGRAKRRIYEDKKKSEGGRSVS
jgi:hypothetical protein